jgi:hypothetical protein
MTEYIFKREEIEDTDGRQIIPAVMLYIQDASNYDDLILFSSQKKAAFVSNGVKVEEILTHESKDYPLRHKNSLFYKCTYNNGLDHVLYMIHIMTEDKKGIQLLLDMTKSIAAECEDEFISILESIDFE